MEKTQRNYFSATRISIIAMFSTLAGVLYAFGFPIAAAFPAWLELNFSDIPALIGTFALGPLSGGIIVFVKVLIKLIIKGTSTVFVGELADLLVGMAFVVPAGLIYKRRRTFKGALAGMGAGMFCSVALSILANWLVLVPFYRQLLFHGSWDPLVGSMQALFGAGCDEGTFYTFYLWCSVLPFNAMRCLIAIAVTLPVYKHVSRLINRLNAKLSPKEKEDGESAREDNKRVIIIACISAGVVLLLVAGALLRYFLS